MSDKDHEISEVVKIGEERKAYYRTNATRSRNLLRGSQVCTLLFTTAGVPLAVLLPSSLNWLQVTFATIASVAATAQTMFSWSEEWVLYGDAAEQVDAELTGLKLRAGPYRHLSAADRASLFYEREVKIRDALRVSWTKLLRRTASTSAEDQKSGKAEPKGGEGEADES